MAGPGTYGKGDVLRVPQLIAKESLFRLSEKLLFPRMFAKKYQKYFEDQSGDTIWLKLPYHAAVTKGRTLGTALPKVDRVIEFKINQRYKFHMKNYDEEIALGLDNFFDRYFGAGLEELAIEYDYQGADAVGLETYFNEGTAGTAMSTDAVQSVREHFDDVAIPDEMNYAILNPADFTAISKDVKAVQREELVAQAVRTRFMGMAGTFESYQSTHLARMQVNDNGVSTPLVDKPQVGSPGDANYVPGGYVGEDVPTNGWAASTEVLRDGQLININGIKEIQPRGSGDRKRPTGRDQAFRVFGAVTSNAAGEATVKVSPEINDGTMTFADEDGAAVAATAFKNVSARAADNAAITLVGGTATEGKTYRQGIFFHKDVATYANIRLPIMKGFTISVHETDPDTALAISILGAPDINNAAETLRADILFGCRAIDGRLAMRYPTTEVG